MSSPDESKYQTDELAYPIPDAAEADTQAENDPFSKVDPAEPIGSGILDSSTLTGPIPVPALSSGSSTPIEATSGPAGDVISGPARKEITTEKEKEIKQMKYAQEMAQQWIQLIQQRSENDPQQRGKLNPQQTAYLLEHLVPILVEALSELLRVHEKEARALHQHAKKLRKNPSMKPMNELQPLEWLASYLVRHNPKHVKNTNPLTLIYQKAIQQGLTDSGAPAAEAKS